MTSSCLWSWACDLSTVKWSLLSPEFDVAIIGTRYAAKAGARWLDVDLFWRFCAGESEALQERGKEEKELHSGQSLSQTRPLPWGKRERERSLSVSWSYNWIEVDQRFSGFLLSFFNEWGNPRLVDQASSNRLGKAQSYHIFEKKNVNRIERYRIQIQVIRRACWKAVGQIQTHAGSGTKYMSSRESAA